MRLTIPTHVVFEILDGQAVVLNLEGGSYYALNESASRLWTLIEAHGDVESVKREFRKEYEVNEEALDADLGGLINDLQARGLLKTEG